MTSTTRTRRCASRGFDTIIFKDMQGLQKWNTGNLKTYFKLGGECNSRSYDKEDCDRLICTETLDDLDDVWAAPLKKKQPPKSKKRRSLSMPSRSVSTHTQPSPCILSAAANFPTDAGLSQEPNRAVGNPYIFYMLHTLPENDCQHTASSPAFSSTLPNRQPEEPEESLIAVSPEDILIIPDSTREDLAFLSPHPKQSRWVCDEQCVPETKLHPEPFKFEDGLFFIEDRLVSSASFQSVPCQADHIVPEVDFEE